MASRVRRSVVGQIAAVLVAVTLSGATTLVLDALHAPGEGHRCLCAARYGERHECDCALCRMAALTARASDPNAPPCHREAARKALAERAPVGSREAPGMECICGDPTEGTATASGPGPFCFPAHPALAVADRAEPALPGVAEPAREGPVEPETPPPRAG